MDHKEQLLQFFLQSIKLSQYDQKFMSNLQLIVHRDNKVTSNQSDLFDKLIEKYNKQLSRYGLVKETMLGLKWKALVVQSSPSYIGARVSIENDRLILKVPFNKTFIAKFREVRNNPFKWERNERCYVAPFTTQGLKVLKENLHKYFSIVQYCSQTESILHSLSEYEAEIWDPTLVKVNGNLVVLAINAVLGELLKDVELKDNLATIFTLSRMGVKIHPSLITDDKTKFASEFITNVDIDDIPKLVEWFAEMGVTHTIMGKGLTMNKPIRYSIAQALEKYKDTFTVPTIEVPPVLFQYHTNPDTRGYYGEHAISKCVIIKNSRPIEVK